MFCSEVKENCPESYRVNSNFFVIVLNIMIRSGHIMLKCGET
jgi:hypothetical protein